MALFPLRENRVLIAAHGGMVLALFPNGEVKEFLKDKGHPSVGTKH